LQAQTLAVERRLTDTVTLTSIKFSVRLHQIIEKEQVWVFVQILRTYHTIAVLLAIRIPVSAQKIAASLVGFTAELWHATQTNDHEARLDLEKLGSDPEELSNYRAISLTLFVQKILEQVVAR